MIPVPSGSVAAKVTIEVRRAAGLTARRNELDGFAGAMARLRATYDALNQVYGPPEILVDAMQTGDRLGYYPETAVAELAHFRQVLPQALEAVTKVGASFVANADTKAKTQRRLDAMARAEKLAAEMAK